MVSLALVVLDTLRKDAFDRHFEWLPGRRFERAYSTANWTVPAHASLFCGKYPSELGTHAKNMTLDCDDPTIAEELRAAGYTTRAFSANTNVTGYFDFDRGFDDFRVPKQIGHLNDDNIFDFRDFNQRTDAEGLEHHSKLLYEIVTSDAATVPSMVALARKVRGENNGVKYGGLIEAQSELSDISFGEEEFLFLNFMEAHEPYRVPPSYRTVDEPSMTNSVGDIYFGSGTFDAEQTTQAYEDCATYLSDKYQALFKELRETFDYVITLADHGELLGEQDAWGHEYGVASPLTHVPLVITGNGLDGTCTDTVSLLDVHQTVLDIADVDGGARGRSLLEEGDENEYLTEYLGLTSWSERKLHQNGFDDQIEQYNEQLRGYVTQSGSYGYQTQDEFIATDDESVSDLQHRLDQLVSELDIRAVETDNDVPDEIKEQLEHLGYA
ncbi:sulfatase-like hydrolase/transferase [Halocatena marina]|uniref:sulfatase-like hydrolase/transferase n=1 Tax=Halocatena marina TaxID=2934937 RepID=UPI00200FD8D7|nr:sulfatase-like hydrolase/transferase [Halocatena marina]